MFEALGFRFSEKKPFLEFTKQEEKNADFFIKKNKIKKFIVIHPGGKYVAESYMSGKWPPHLWNLERYAKVADYFSEKGYKIIITGSKEEEILAEEIKKYFSQLHQSLSIKIEIVNSLQTMSNWREEPYFERMLALSQSYEDVCGLYFGPLVYFDGEKDISADDCASVSREIDSYLKDLLVKHPDFRLDVSSPGIDRPLKFLKQYPKHVNRKFEISYRSGKEIKKLNGKLASIEGDYLTFISNNKEVIINFNNIVKANLVVSFS